MSALDDLMKMADTMSKEFMKKVPEVERMIADKTAELTNDQRQEYSDILNKGNQLLKKAKEGKVTPQEVNDFVDASSNN